MLITVCQKKHVYGKRCRQLRAQQLRLHTTQAVFARKVKSQTITVGNDTWIGGNVTVCPGVTIGNRCIIAAGSVVVHDIPDDSLAAGNPAVVKKKLQ